MLPPALEFNLNGCNIYHITAFSSLDQKFFKFFFRFFLTMQRPGWLPEDIQLKSSSRRKNFGIKLNFDGSCELLVPDSATELQLERVFRKFAPWLRRKRQQLAIENQSAPPHEFTFQINSEFFFLGKKYPLQLTNSAPSGIIKFDGAAFQTTTADPDSIRVMLENFYRRQTRRIIQLHLEKACVVCNTNYRKLSINGARKRFGSCNTHGDLNFSWHLAMYPEHLIELIVYHELAHRSEMNHSARFYQLLAARLPDHRQRNQELKLWIRHLAGYPA